MKSSYCLLVFLPLLALFTKLVHTAEPATMLDAIMNECSLDKSQKDKYEALPEFMECKNWTAIQSVDFSEENKMYIKCLLYHDALVYLCRHNASVVSSAILNAEPDSTSLSKVCENLMDKQNESRILKDLTPDLCNYLCGKMLKRQLISDVFCTKSYTFFNYIKNDPEKVVEMNSNKQEPPNDSNESVNKKNLTLADNKTKSETAVSEETPNLEVKKKSKIDVPEDLPLQENENRQEVLENDKHNKSETSDNIQNILKHNSETIEGNNKVGVENIPEPNSKAIEGDKVQAVQDPVVKEVDKKTDKSIDAAPETAVEQEGPPNNLNPNIQSTDQGQAYQDDDDVVYQLEKDQKIVNQPVETPQESIDDRGALTQNDFKKPLVSPLSESLAYDADISGNSYFFSYFSFTCVVLVVGYVFYHNKQKVLALLVEGRHARRPQRTRRPNSANYHKLDSNLEEAISSSVSKNPSHVIY